MNFPSIQAPSYPLKVEYQNTSLISDFEDGSSQSRQKFTRSRRTFVLTWNALSNSDYTTLFNFIKGECKFSALSFNWTHPLTSEVIEVRATDGFGSWQLNETHYWSGDLTLQEV